MRIIGSCHCKCNNWRVRLCAVVAVMGERLMCKSTMCLNIFGKSNVDKLEDRNVTEDSAAVKYCDAIVSFIPK